MVFLGEDVDMNQKKAKQLFLLTVAAALAMTLAAAGLTVWVDPYLRYHRPGLDTFYYTLDNERAQNDGLARFLDYEGVITGTSMTQNFRTSEAEPLFGIRFLKAPFSDATYSEQHRFLVRVFEQNPQLGLVIRSLDTNRIWEETDAADRNLHAYPSYVLSDTPWNQLEYLLNREVLYGYTMPMLLGRLRGEAPGITDFDWYSQWGNYASYGPSGALESWSDFSAPQTQATPGRDDRDKLDWTVETYLIPLLEAHPDTRFYLFIPPYSAVWWGKLWHDGNLNRQLELEAQMVSRLLEYENVRLFAWGDVLPVVEDLGNYKDYVHYGDWVNSWMLEQMAAGAGALTLENYRDYYARLRLLWRDYDYAALFDQPEPGGRRIPEFFRE